MKIAIVMGSVSDYDKVKEACEFLNMLEVPFEIRALSAHRTSVELDSFIEKYDDEIDVYIAAAGKAAHLPGVIAAKTCKPVIFNRRVVHDRHLNEHHHFYLNVF